MSKLLCTDCSLVFKHKNFGSLGMLLPIMFFQSAFSSVSLGSEMQDLLPAAAFTALG